MDRIIQEACHRQRILNWAAKHGVTDASIRYKISRKTIHKWKKRYDGSIESLKDRSRTPHHVARKQTSAELKLVKRYAKKYAGDLLLGYESALNSGYERSYGCFKRTAAKLVNPSKKRKSSRKNKPYQRAEYPGQKVQMDVKFVPSYCVVNGEKYYQFTAKDECSRWTYREMYAEHSTASAKDFLEKLVQKAPFPIRMVQTDNGTEFTNALLVTKSKHKTLFEEALIEMGIEYHRIRIATPRHNGKVERQHRTDEFRFYRNMKIYSLEDGRKQLAVYQRESNTHIMTCLGIHRLSFNPFAAQQRLSSYRQHNHHVDKAEYRRQHLSRMSVSIRCLFFALMQRRIQF